MKKIIFSHLDRRNLNSREMRRDKIVGVTNPLFARCFYRNENGGIIIQKFLQNIRGRLILSMK
jgi:hypothetical protein